VVARRAAVKEVAAARQAALYVSCKFHSFSADVNDLRGWMVDKLKTANDESYRDLTNLERKLQKHEAFARELHANEGQLHAVNKESIRDSIILGSMHTRGTGFDHFISCNMKIAEN
jgi:spectrin beta